MINTGVMTGTTASQGTTVTVESQGTTGTTASREKSPTHHLATCFGMPPFTLMPVVLSALSGNDKKAGLINAGVMTAKLDTTGTTASRDTTAKTVTVESQGTTASRETASSIVQAFFCLAAR